MPNVDKSIPLIYQFLTKYKMKLKASVKHFEMNIDITLGYQVRTSLSAFLINTPQDIQVFLAWLS